MPGMLVKTGMNGRKGSRLASTSPLGFGRVDFGDGPVQRIDLLEMQPQQAAMVLGHPSAQGLGQRLGRGLDPRAGQTGELGRVGLAADQGLDHRPPAGSDEIGDRRIQLDVGLVQRLLQALDVAGALPRELLARPQQTALLLRLGILARISPCASNVASFTSVLRPGTFLTWAALASISSKSPSLRMFQTGCR